MTLRARLFLAAIVIAATVIVALGYVAIRQQSVLTAQLDDQLRAVAPRLERIDRFDQFDGPAEVGRDRIPPTGELYFAIVNLDSTTQVIAQPVSHPNLVPDLTGIDLAEKAAPAVPFTTGVVGATGTARVMVIEGGDDRWVVVAISTAAVDDAQDQLLTTAAIALTVIMATMAVMLWSMDRLGLAPITTVTLAAEDIASGKSDRRVTHPAISTEAGRLGAAFNTMLDARQAAETQQRRFVADASHELRTPLTTLRGYTALYEKGGLRTAAQTNDAMDRIGSEAKRMQVLVDDLLTLASLDDQRPLDIQDVNVSQLLRDIAADARAVQPERHIELDRPDSAVIVSADRHQLTQALTTIATNALSHTPVSAPVKLLAQPTQTGVRITIEDRGPGIGQEHLDHLFDRFYRADAGRTRAAGGSGLGLAIAKAIVEAHGGTIAAQSTLAIGTTITIDLPKFLSANQDHPIDKESK